MNTTHKKTVLLLFGGESSEHDVSIMSAKNVYDALDFDAVEPVLGYIDPSGNWWRVDAVEKPAALDASIMPLLGASQIAIGDQLLNIDVIFPVLHGRNGEDGTVQGLATLLHTPIVGCGLDASILCMDKTLTKQLLAAADIPVVPGRICRAVDEPPTFVELTDELGPVLFLKPVRQGSSVGVGKARTEAEYLAAFREAAKYDDTILIESAVDGVREFEIAMLGDMQVARASVVGEVVPDREFYDYDSKYDDASSSQTVIPAEIDAELDARIRHYAEAAYAVLHCRGLARIDFFVAKDGALYLNEVNTMPGFTNISMYPKLWEATGLPYRDLVATLIDSAR